MYKVYYVEDEFLARKYAKTSSIWDDDKYELVGIASNGQEAWERLQETPIDILITDIRMPFMDGIELSKLVKEHLPHIKIVILSGHSDFDYAQSALKIGVTDYQLKPMRANDLLKVLDKIILEIEDERAIQKKLSSLDQLIHDHNRIREIKLLSDLAGGIVSKHQLIKEIEALNINIIGESYISAIIEITPGNHHRLDDNDLVMYMLDMQNTVYALIEEMDDIHVFSKNSNQLYLIHTLSHNSTISDFLDVLKEIQFEIKEVMKHCKVLVAMGREKRSIEEISASFSEAELLLKYKSLFDLKKILVYDDLLTKINSDYSSSVSFNNEKALVKNLLFHGNPSDVPSVIQQIRNKLNSSEFSYDFKIFIRQELMHCLYDFIEEIDGDVNKIFTDDVISPDDDVLWLEKINHSDAFSDYYQQLILDILSHRDKIRNFKYTNVIEAATKYIESHYNDPNLRLSSAAEFVGLSNSYFSTVFKKETGMSFIEYLTSFRIDKAESLLLTTSKSFTEIAFDLGYQDSNYFSKIFKKVTGQSPRTFKKSNGA